jgi:hypothetical protein
VADELDVAAPLTGFHESRSFKKTVDTAIVPKKSEIPVGTLRSILSQAHIDVGDWDKLG